MSDEQYPPAPPLQSPPPPLAPPSLAPASQRFPTWKQALVLFLGGGALAISACFGCLFATLGAGNRTNSALEGVGIFLGIVAFVGLLASLVGVVLVLMRMLRALFAKKDESSSVSGSNSGSNSGSAS